MAPAKNKTPKRSASLRGTGLSLSDYLQRDSDLRKVYDRPRAKPRSSWLATCPTASRTTCFSSAKILRPVFSFKLRVRTTRWRI